MTTMTNGTVHNDDEYYQDCTGSIIRQRFRQEIHEILSKRKNRTARKLPVRAPAEPEAMTLPSNLTSSQVQTEKIEEHEILQKKLQDILHKNITDQAWQKKLPELPRRRSLIIPDIDHTGSRSEDSKRLDRQVEDSRKTLEELNRTTTRLTKELKQNRRKHWDQRTEQASVERRIAALLKQHADQHPEDEQGLEDQKEEERLQQQESQLLRELHTARNDAVHWHSVAKRQEEMLAQEAEMPMSGARRFIFPTNHPAGDIFFVPRRHADDDSDDDHSFSGRYHEADDSDEDYRGPGGPPPPPPAQQWRGLAHDSESESDASMSDSGALSASQSPSGGDALGDREKLGGHMLSAGPSGATARAGIGGRRGRTSGSSSEEEFDESAEVESSLDGGGMAGLGNLRVGVSAPQREPVPPPPVRALAVGARPTPAPISAGSDSESNSDSGRSPSGVPSSPNKWVSAVDKMKTAALKEFREHEEKKAADGQAQTVPPLPAGADGEASEVSEDLDNSDSEDV